MIPQVADIDPGRFSTGHHSVGATGEARRRSVEVHVGHEPASGGLPPPAMADISTSYCFICLLHLANEKGLELGNEAGLEELSIRKDFTAEITEGGINHSWLLTRRGCFPRDASVSLGVGVLDSRDARRWWFGRDIGYISYYKFSHLRTGLMMACLGSKPNASCQCILHMCF